MKIAVIVPRTVEMTITAKASRKLNR